MIVVRFEFDLAAPSTADGFARLPEALAGLSVVIDLWPAAPPAGDPSEPWVRLLWACAPRGGTPGRWPCEQVISRWQHEPIDRVAASLQPARDAATVALPAPTPGHRPAFVLGAERFTGDDALVRLVAALGR